MITYDEWKKDQIRRQDAKARLDRNPPCLKPVHHRKKLKNLEGGARRSPPGFCDHKPTHLRSNKDGGYYCMHCGTVVHEPITKGRNNEVEY